MNLISFLVDLSQTCVFYIRINNRWDIRFKRLKSFESYFLEKDPMPKIKNLILTKFIHENSIKIVSFRFITGFV